MIDTSERLKAYEQLGENGHEPERSILVIRRMKEALRKGDRFSIKAVLYGFGDLDYTVQWQYNEGASWKNFTGGNGLILDLVADDDNVRYQWRVLVTTKEKQPVAWIAE